MRVECTPRFLDQLSRYNGIDGLVYKRIAELKRKFDSDPNKWHFELEKLKDKSLEPLNVAKIALTQGDRLVFTIESAGITLVDIGKHEVMQEYANIPRSKRLLDYEARARTPKWFENGVDKAFKIKESPRQIRQTIESNFVDLLSENIDSGERWLFEEELSEQWITFLDNEQFKTATEIYEDINKNQSNFQVHLIIGGPGTGKTIILLNIYNQLIKKALPVTFEVSKAVKSYLESAGTAIKYANRGLSAGIYALIDDPVSPRELASTIRKAKSAKVKGIVVALDPLQWHERNLQSKYEDLVNDFEIKTHSVWTCYRQSMYVGKKASELTELAFTKSSGYLNVEKQELERDGLAPFLDLTLNMQFVDEAGRFKIYEHDVWQNYEIEIERFKNRYDIWRHTSPVLFVFEENVSIKLIQNVREISVGINRKDLTFSRYRDIRGIEFQELFIFVSKDYWDGLQIGRKGLGQEEWEKLTCLHTLLSRPKDSAVLFVV